jgi:hypothetical protein
MIERRLGDFVEVESPSLQKVIHPVCQVRRPLAEGRQSSSKFSVSKVKHALTPSTPELLVVLIVAFLSPGPALLFGRHKTKITYVIFSHA